jgi:hypothetical protein
MENIKNLLNRFRQSGVLLFIGFLLIIYIAFGFVYWQQSAQQKDLEEQVARISSIVAKELPNKEELQADYDKINSVLTMKDIEISIDEDITTNAKAIAIIVGIAERNGIDVAPASDKLIVPSAAVREEQVGRGTYQVFSFTNINVQGDYDTVMAFISDLDSGTTQETMVLTRITINQTEVTVEGEEATEGEEEVEVGTRIEANATLDVDLYTKL